MSHRSRVRTPQGVWEYLVFPCVVKAVRCFARACGAQPDALHSRSRLRLTQGKANAHARRAAIVDTLGVEPRAFRRGPAVSTCQQPGRRKGASLAIEGPSAVCYRPSASTHTPALQQPHEHVQRHCAGVAVQAQPARTGRRARSLLKVYKKCRRKCCCATLPGTRSGTQHNWRDTRRSGTAWRSHSALQTRPAQRYGAKGLRDRNSPTRTVSQNGDVRYNVSTPTPCVTPQPPPRRAPRPQPALASTIVEYQNRALDLAASVARQSRAHRNLTAPEASGATRSRHTLRAAGCQRSAAASACQGRLRVQQVSSLGKRALRSARAPPHRSNEARPARRMRQIE